MIKLGRIMNNTTQRRKKLKNEFVETFIEEITDLSPEMQAILLDELVPAFENRLSFFKKLNKENPQFQIANTEEIEFIHV